MKAPTHFFTTRLLPAIAAAALAGCASPGFRDAWLEAQSSPARRDLSGPWEGTWKSSKTGHAGALRCLVSASDDEKGCYDFHYWASWKKALTGEFQVRYPVSRKGETYFFGGKHDLGKAFGGVFEHKGEATATEFKSTYSSANDSGEFRMKRL